MKCDINKNECIACNEGYKLLNGKCFYYSFKAIYNTTSINESIYLINSDYVNNITNMIIDGNETKPGFKYIFPKPGYHKVFFFFNINKNSSTLNRMFYSINNLVEISFTSNFNTQNIISMSYMFYECQN